MFDGQAIREIMKIGVEMESLRRTCTEYFDERTKATEALAEMTAANERDAAGFAAEIVKLQAANAGLELQQAGFRNMAGDVVDAATVALAADGGRPGTVMEALKMMADAIDHHRRFRQCHKAEIDEAREVLSEARTWQRAHYAVPIASRDVLKAIEHHEIISLGEVIRRLGKVHEDDLGKLLDATGERDAALIRRDECARDLEHEKNAHGNTALDARQLIDDAHRAAEQAGKFRDEAIAKLRVREAEIRAAEGLAEERRGKLDAFVRLVTERIARLDTDTRRSFSRFGEGADGKAAHDLERDHRRAEAADLLAELQGVLDWRPPGDS